MDKFVIRKTSQPTKRVIVDDHDSSDSDCELHPLKKVAAMSSAGSIKMRAYKSKLTYTASWKKIYPWMKYDSHLRGMVCTVCKDYGKVPVQARGAWVTRAVDNWVKATE